MPPGERWAQRYLPFYARWFRFIATFPGVPVGTTPYRQDPDYDDPTSTSVNAANAARRDILLEWMKSTLAERPDLIENCREFRWLAELFAGG